MLSNELAVVAKRLLIKDWVSERRVLARDHIFAIGSDCGKDKKQKTKFDFNIVVDKNYDFNCDPNDYMDQNVLKYAYAIQYRNSPSDSTGKGPQYFGDITIKIKNKKISLSFDEFKEIMCTPLEEAVEAPEYMVRFKESMCKDSNIKMLWKFIEDQTKRIQSTEEGKKFDRLYLHFDFTAIFPKIYNWHEIPGALETMDAMYIERALREKIFEYIPEGKTYALSRSFLPTVASGDPSNDIQFPDFLISNKYKTFNIRNKADLRCVLYHEGVMSSLKLALYKTDPYFFQIIPSGLFPEEDLMYFMSRIDDIRKSSFKKGEKKLADEVSTAESGVSPDEETEETMDEDAEEEDTSSTFFDATEKVMQQVIQDSPISMTSFDIILVRKESQTLVTTSELNNIFRSSLLSNLNRIGAIAEEIQKKFKLSSPPTLGNSFYSIHRAIKKGEKYKQKYISFLLANIRGLYYGDSDLANIYIEHCLRLIRNDESKFLFSMKIAYEFIKALNMKGPIMPQQQSKQLGECCAILALPVSQVIKSFYKGELGHLDRRVQDTEGVRKFAQDMMQSLVRHNGEVIEGRIVSTDSLSPSFCKITELLAEIENSDGKIKFSKTVFIEAVLDKFFRELHKYGNTKSENE